MVRPTLHVIVIGSMRFPAENMDAVRQLLREFVHASQASEGCIAYAAAEDFFEPGLIRFSEVWRDDAALAQHLVAPYAAPWRAATAELGAHDRKFMAFDAESPRAV